MAKLILQMDFMSILTKKKILSILKKYVLQIKINKYLTFNFGTRNLQFCAFKVISDL